jgi:hypothetical protein
VFFIKVFYPQFHFLKNLFFGRCERLQNLEQKKHPIQCCSISRLCTDFSMEEGDVVVESFIAKQEL